jgi:hypothetical protein
MFKHTEWGYWITVNEIQVVYKLTVKNTTYEVLKIQKKYRVSKRIVQTIHQKIWDWLIIGWTIAYELLRHVNSMERDKAQNTVNSLLFLYSLKIWCYSWHILKFQRFGFWIPSWQLTVRMEFFRVFVQSVQPSAGLVASCHPTIQTIKSNIYIHKF